jgi:UDP-N-acetyl-D-glucosamine/UDP-N-acetyl-D-galactosamine dehydrogenase
MKNPTYQIGLIGLGYVGLPLAIEFGKKYEVVGFDINKNRIKELERGFDSTLESTLEELKDAFHLTFTTNPEGIKGCNIYIITVETPVDYDKKPDLSSLKKATSLIGKILNKGNIVIFESTVYPGTTEEVCVPILEEESGLKFNKDFFCGYSPERVVPGDKKNRLTNIKKVTSGSTHEIAIQIDALYQEIIEAGTHMASSIKVAEASKVIENTQRDVNIALINELSLIFNKMGIDTESVLKAAGTKWNFHSFRPGLVGGHCIGVDPYYLIHKSNEVGYSPDIISASRKLNDSIGSYIATQVIKLIKEKSPNIVKPNILVMGFTFKEDCPDIRNTGVISLFQELTRLNNNIDIYDPWADKKEVFDQYGVQLLDSPIKGKYDAIILAVAHNEFKKIPVNLIRSFGKTAHIIYDVKYILKNDEVDGRL